MYDVLRCYYFGGSLKTTRGKDWEANPYHLHWFALARDFLDFYDFQELLKKTFAKPKCLKPRFKLESSAHAQASNGLSPSMCSPVLFEKQWKTTVPYTIMEPGNDRGLRKVI